MSHPNGQTHNLDRLMASEEACPARCECHSSPYASCTVPGGCGSEGCGQSARGGCITCHLYWPKRDPGAAVQAPSPQPNIPDRPPVCDSCRYRISRHLDDIGRYHHRLANPDPIQYDTRWYDAEYHTWNHDRKQWDEHSEERRADPLAAVGGAAATPSRSRQPSVSGSRERPAPTSLDRLDLLAGVHHFNPTRNRSQQPNQHPADAVGHQSVATSLDDWARDWRDTLYPDQHLPAPTVPALVRWLRAGADFDNPGTRIDDACDHHPAIADIAAEIRDLRTVLRRAVGDTEPRPEPLPFIECRRCDQRTLQWRTDGEDGVECTNPDCLRTYDRDNHDGYVAHTAAYERSIRSQEEIDEIMRRYYDRRDTPTRPAA